MLSFSFIPKKKENIKLFCCHKFFYQLRDVHYLGKHKYINEFLALQVYSLFTLEIFSADFRHFYVFFMQEGICMADSWFMYNVCVQLHGSQMSKRYEFLYKILYEWKLMVEEILQVQLMAQGSGLHNQHPARNLLLLCAFRKNWKKKYIFTLKIRFLMKIVNVVLHLLQSKQKTHIYIYLMLLLLVDQQANSKTPNGFQNELHALNTCGRKRILTKKFSPRRRCKTSLSSREAPFKSPLNIDEREFYAHGKTRDISTSSPRYSEESFSSRVRKEYVKFLSPLLFYLTSQNILFYVTYCCCFLDTAGVCSHCCYFLDYCCS